MSETSEVGGTLFPENPQDPNTKFVLIGLPLKDQNVLFQAYYHIGDLTVDIADYERRVECLRKQLQGVRNLGVFYPIPELDYDIGDLEGKIESLKRKLAEQMSVLSEIKHCEQCRGTGREHYDLNKKSLLRCSYCKGSGKP